jgi:uncharacterized protein YkwD
MADTDTATLCHSVARAWTRSRGFAIAWAASVILTATILPSAATAHPRRGCAHAHTPIVAASRPELRASVVCLINRERAAHRLPRLRENRRLNRSAQGWTNSMVRHGEFSHGADFAGRISAAGFNWSMVGEDLATGFMTPSAVLRAWMASRGHCRNILTPAYADVGTGVSDRPVGGRGLAGTWTLDFGLPMGSPDPSTNWSPADGCPYG